MKKVLVNYSEIAIKGKNRYKFENKLVENIKKSSKYFDVNLISVEKIKGRIVCIYKDEDEKIIKNLKNVFGIRHFSFIDEIEKDLDVILKKAKEKILELKGREVERIGFKTKRTDKSFKPNSVELNTIMGEIATNNSIKVDYKNPQATIHLIINTDRVYMHEDKINGPGGLPVGTAGKTLVLLSGGIDSPVAAYNIMRRGCECDFIHFHTYPENKKVLNTKIKDTIEILNRYQFGAKIHLVPYSMYEILTIGKIYDRYELVFFKHYILKVADKVAQKDGYDALVNGDNLAQVASQTIENLTSASINIEKEIFRPLLTYEKEEIIEIAKRIDTFDLSIKEYKDCCSLFAKNPATQTKPAKFKEILEKVDVEELVDKSINEIEVFDIN